MGWVYCDTSEYSEDIASVSVTPCKDASCCPHGFCTHSIFWCSDRYLHTLMRTPHTQIFSSLGWTVPAPAAFSLLSH